MEKEWNMGEKGRRKRGRCEAEKEWNRGEKAIRKRGR
jgi:hypothetical protein